MNTLVISFQLYIYSILTKLGFSLITLRKGRYYNENLKRLASFCAKCHNIKTSSRNVYSVPKQNNLDTPHFVIGLHTISLIRLLCFFNILHSHYFYYCICCNNIVIFELKFFYLLKIFFQLC